MNRVVGYYALIVAFVACWVGAASPVRADDAASAQWTALLAKHVSWNEEGTASGVDYAGFAEDRQRLGEYLESLSAVSMATYQGWNKAQRWAFLINAYNAFTIELILTKYPDLESIKDLGSWFSSPWKQEFVDLLGAKRSLDEIEHELLRGSDEYDDPRIHFAVNCASVGCPALRPEAYTAERLDAQLEDQTRRFLADRSRNRVDVQSRTVMVSKIFDWYGDDFEQAFRSADSLAGFLALYADDLGLDDEQAAALAKGDYRIRHLDYDWLLNDAGTVR